MYKKVLLKVSGEMFLAQDGSAFDFEKYKQVGKVLAEFADKNEIQLAVVCGAGNLWRYRDTTGSGLNRVEADRLGMTATAFNAVLLENAINAEGMPSIAVTDFAIPGLMDSYDAVLSKEYLEQGMVLVLAGGTGNPFFTTDSCAVLRALELECELVMKATKVDGVYNSDPNKNPAAKKYETITYDEAIEKSLEVMDLAAVALARENKLPVLVFDFSDFDNLQKVYNDFTLGTLITS